MLCAVLFLASLLTNAVDVLDAIRSERIGAPFSLKGVCVIQNPQQHTSFLLADDTGAIDLSLAGGAPISVEPHMTVTGTVLEVSGKIRSNARGFTIAQYDKLSVAGRQALPAPLFVRLSDLPSEKYECRLIRTAGTVKDVFRDEIDPLWHFIILTDNATSFYMPVFTGERPPELLSNLIGAQVEITGVCKRTPSSPREFQGQTIFVFDHRQISVLKSPPADLFDVPPIRNRHDMTLGRIAAAGRRRISGHVIAVRQNHGIVLRDETGKVHNVELSGSETPAYGEYVTVSGFPETDLYHLNLSFASWRHQDGPAFHEPPVQQIASPADLCRSGKKDINPDLHGRLVRLTGAIGDGKSSGMRNGLIHLQHEDFPIQVDIDAIPNARETLADAREVEITGTYLVDCDNWRSYSRFPHITGATIVPRTPEDLRIITSAPWWTPGRLATLVAVLVAALVGILTWNLMLKRLVERRGRELLQEQINHVTAELKVDERTRLAVELHDTVAQNLTGVEMEIETAEKLFALAPKDTFLHLGLAKRTLHSCREELRNCLWDLRNQALEEPDFNVAIRRTLVPDLPGVKATVRFNIPRALFSDHSAHTILRIIRELAVNAIRHGHATALQIAGGIDGDILMFSVTNNGAAFDPASAPGIREGHFGLLGIRERLRKFGGTLEFSNLREGGVRAKVVMRLPHASERERDIT